MLKNKDSFNTRNDKKYFLHSQSGKKTFINMREIWYVSLGNNIGYEEDGKGNDYKRPVLVLKKLGITSQPKAIDKKRFIEKIGILSETDFETIKKELIAFWF
ncbi:MAG: hypothetical protein CR971_01625 [candidate division SR1 bacterium]|nr:MAG: hypothetical protein CR971_01625 [candidate division SR1 bacterium]